MNDKCPFCQRRILTELYRENRIIWIVRDTKKKGYDLRILCVWKEHKSMEEIDLQEKLYMKRAVDIICLSFFSQYKKVKIDEKHTLISDHAHIQFCLKLKKLDKLQS